MSAGADSPPPSRAPSLHPVGPIPPDAAGAEADALRVAQAVREAGGRALIVGGYVRDRMLLGVSEGDPDLEVFGLSARRLERALAPLGKVHRVGRSFPVLRIGGMAVEVALPRRESKTGPGHLGFEVAADPDLTFPEAARRRDLSLNAMGLDPLTGELLDPYRGAEALAARTMRATDAAKFPEDPLRGLRVAAFASRFRFEADTDLARLCSELDLSELSAERIYDELGKILRGEEPSRGLRFLAETDLLRFFPELAALRGAGSEAEPERGGGAFGRTLGALDRAAALPNPDADDRMPLLYAVLCHDFGRGRPGANGNPPEPERAAAGARLATGFLERIRAPRALTLVVAALVRHQETPARYGGQPASRAAFCRLARELDAAGTTAEKLLQFAEVLAPAGNDAGNDAGKDAAGTDDGAREEGGFPEGDAFREAAEAAGVFRKPPVAAVTGKRVLARGIAPGKHVGRILQRCRDLQDETGETDPERILDRVLAEEP